MYLFNIHETLHDTSGRPFSGNPVSIQFLNRNSPVRLYTQQGLLISNSGHTNLDPSGILDVFVGRSDLVRVTVYNLQNNKVLAVLNSVRPLTMNAAGGTLTGSPPGIGSEFDIYSLPDETSVSKSDYLPVSTGVGANARMTVSDLIALVPGSSGGTYPELDSYQNVDAVTMQYGQPVYSPGAGQVKLAQGVTSMRKVIGLCADAGGLLAGGSGNFLVSGSLVATSTQWQVVTGMAGGLVPGSKYYLSMSSPGQLLTIFSTTGAPTGSYLVPVGYAVSQTEFVFEPTTPIRVA